MHATLAIRAIVGLTLLCRVQRMISWDSARPSERALRVANCLTTDAIRLLWEPAKKWAPDALV
jgi:hypothetical protein